ncbi:nucleoporin protein Ndc1-Nup [Bombardia bombarda]|uniref:Nucleoporin protein Ndc1-Nup n=1 Tax=Bombardia bombarda TaxID=252184 RepID=A0AA40CD78_9PEZI|nr:nucleoporin protein Ndc1-Nup [Bombardia bombarda]
MAPTTVRRSPYKDLLQPALQRRFISTVLFLIAIVYIQAVYLSSWDSFFWTWFPLGPTGVRAVLLLVCGLIIIILRISQYHVGLRTADSAFANFAKHALQFQTAETAVSYTVSAYIFSQLYLWSLPKEAGLEWITYFAPDRARLNEKAIYFTAHILILGLVQAWTHLSNDVDRLSLGVVKAKKNGTGGGAGEAEDKVPIYAKLWSIIKPLAMTAFNRALYALAVSGIVYPFFLRSIVWRVMVFFLRPIYNLPRTNMLPVSLPFSLWSIVRCFTASLLLLLLWSAANTAFSILLAKEPLKDGKPLTNDSRDPNGSLLNGLKSKKLPIQGFALWELAFIARDFPDRRKAIYEDIDRKDGPMWSHVYTICLKVLKDMESRIDSFGKPAQPAAPPAVATLAPKQRTTAPPSDEPIFIRTPPKKSFRAEVEKGLSQVVTAPGQKSQLSPIAKKALTTTKQQLLSAQKEVTGSDDPQGLLQDLALWVVKYPFGWPFRHEYNRRLTICVLGTPYGEASIIMNAAFALGQLAVHSLAEDKYGNVQRDIAAIIRTLTTATRKLETFKDTLGTHWTDVDSKRECPEVEVILETLRETLASVVEAFGPYARDLRLTLTDMRLAREAAGVERGHDFLPSSAVMG